MIACLDCGNTRMKLGLFSPEGKEPQHVQTVANPNWRDLLPLLQEATLAGLALSSVVNVPEDLLEALQPLSPKMLMLSHTTPLPFANRYETPETLGRDRLAAVAGAFAQDPQASWLVMDAGTCITYDALSARKGYLGGAISPGWKMRLQAMHHYTQRLPLVEEQVPQHVIGRSTAASLRGGAFWGLAGEINGFITSYSEELPGMKVAMTGGDAPALRPYLPENIFTHPHLTLLGLKEIFSFNDA